jgi:hypothetical protein
MNRDALSRLPSSRPDCRIEAQIIPGRLDRNLSAVGTGDGVVERGGDVVGVEEAAAAALTDTKPGATGYGEGRDGLQSKRCAECQKQILMVQCSARIAEHRTDRCTTRGICSSVHGC